MKHVETSTDVVVQGFISSVLIGAINLKAGANARALDVFVWISTGFRYDRLIL
jgi:hypothetical protein